jgi:H+/Cl- antiporter ClcA
MSRNKKKHKGQKQPQNSPWLLVALGGVLLVIAAFFFANRGGGGDGTPAIAVDQQKIDYGDVKFGVEKTFAIKVTNTGAGTLRFKEDPYIEVLEGC